MDELNYKRLTESVLDKKWANQQDTDFLPEAVAASLIEQGYNPEQIQIVREGHASRGFSKEVESIELKYFMQTLLVGCKKCLLFNIKIRSNFVPLQKYLIWQQQIGKARQPNMPVTRND